ncbi:hypothetical protein H5183_12840 [Pseudoalteromonas sp. SR44-8]|uniref:hypothetical protein n=1 Tax=Pseudoalteromonas sp. SR44-8 TaxID=2760933 RepID=UPI0015FEF5ED|nr:hypothetical protein [Pseudoalteromonas sp. SR44-8]MBB1302229.1 hypothetical protein [Pseudoalteromonas sp. SR44-8]
MRVPAILSFIIIFSFPVNAKIADISWNEFIEQTELVAFVSIQEMKRIDETYGVTKVKVLKVINGTDNHKEIDVDWSIGRISQPLFDIYHNYVVFLKKKDNGKYEASIIGRSFWKVEKDYSTQEYFVDLDMDIHMRNLINIPEYIYSLREVSPNNQHGKPYNVRRVYLKKLTEYFESNKT